jgi:predicted  nucleic acid-binding Zn-ribbon protein
MLSSLTALIALQSLDSASDGARRRLSEFPAMEEAIDARIAAAAAAVDAARSRLAEIQTARRALEKDVALIDSRLARFDDHKAAVKTNQEYTALLHEISAAKTEKDAIEERILESMEQTDAISAELKAHEAALADVKRDAGDARKRLGEERQSLEAELARLTADRTHEKAAVPGPLLSKYEQLVKQRRGIAVAQMTGETCKACHVRLRPHVAQIIRRNDEIIQCESCQRILYFAPPAPADSSATAS